MAIGCALAWAIAVLLFSKLAHVPAYALNLFKNSLASALLCCTMLVLGLRFDGDRSTIDWAVLIGSGVLGLGIADSLFFAGLRRIDASIAAITDCAYAPTVLLISALWLHETPGIGLGIGGPLVLAGLALATWPAKSAQGNTKNVDRGGVVLNALGVICTACGIVFAKRVFERSELIEATTVRTLAGTTSLYLFHLLRGNLRSAMQLFRPQRDWRFALGGTFFGTYVSMLLWLGGMRLGAAGRTAILNQLGAIFVLVLAHLLGQRAPRRRWLGASVAVSGAALVLSL